jgi:hypothetical protein
MDERRFDELTKALVGAKPSRREALRRLAGGALATVFGGVTLEGASARRRRVGIERSTCGQNCSDNNECNAGLQCGEISLECFAIPNSRADCSRNVNCTRDYETCNDNDKCVNTVAPKDCKECIKNGDCEDSGRVCSADHRCIVPDCTDNNECGKNKKCRKGECVRVD